MVGLGRVAQPEMVRVELARDVAEVLAFREPARRDDDERRSVRSGRADGRGGRTDHRRSVPDRTLSRAWRGGAGVPRAAAPTETAPRGSTRPRPARPGGRAAA